MATVQSPRRDVLPDAVVHLEAASIKVVQSRSQDFTTDIDDNRTVQLAVKPSDIDENAVVELQIDGYDHSGIELREIMLLTSDNNDGTVPHRFLFCEATNRSESNKI